MARAAKQSGAAAALVEFMGPPGRLVAVGPLPEVSGVPRITGKLEDYLLPDRQALRVRRAGRRGGPRVSLRLDPATPPGDYEGELALDGKAVQPFRAHVLADTRVSLLAGALDFAAAPGETAVARLALANDGNTEIEVPRAIAVGLFDDDGLETAFAASYAKPLAGIDAFVEVFHGKLREAHSGLMKLAVKKGHGSHAPGAVFTLDCALELKPPLRAGRRYHGVATMAFGDFPITVSVRNGADR